MNELTTEKAMTVQEVSKMFDCADNTILNAVKKYFPEKIKHGVKTFLNESEITVIKKELELHHNTASTCALPKTNLEKQLIIRQAMQILDEQIEDLKRENDEMKPKALTYDKFLSASGWQTITEAANVLGIGRNNLFLKLRQMNILKQNNTPYQEYLDRGYFKVIDKPITIGEDVINKPLTLVNAKGIEYISKLLESFIEDVIS